MRPSNQRVVLSDPHRTVDLSARRLLIRRSKKGLNEFSVNARAGTEVRAIVGQRFDGPVKSAKGIT